MGSGPHEEQPQTEAFHIAQRRLPPQSCKSVYFAAGCPFSTRGAATFAIAFAPATGRDRHPQAAINRAEPPRRDAEDDRSRVPASPRHRQNGQVTVRGLAPNLTPASPDPPHRLRARIHLKTVANDA